MSDERYCYIFIRQDLPHPVQIVQTSHATAQAQAEWGGVETANFVLIGVKNPRELLYAAARLEAANIGYSMFYEPDGGVGFTSICTTPLPKSMQAQFKRYELMK